MKKIYIKDLKQIEETELYCFISNKRKFKNIIFLDVYDSTGEVQAIVSKNKCEDYDEIKKIMVESAVKLFGKMNKEGSFEVTRCEIIASSKLNLQVSPNSKKFNPLLPKNSKYVIDHNTIYIRNRLLSKIYFLKSCLKKEMQDYLWSKDFIEFESPTLTKQTLYENEKAIWFDFNNTMISLSRCATFHLEPSVIPYEKVFTITNSFSGEPIKSNRHLAEYMHLKIEICWINLEELIDFAGQMYYSIAQKMISKYKNDFLLVVSEEKLNDKLEKINPKNHVIITYEEALNILKDHKCFLEFGKSLTTKQEKILTAHFGERFVWVKYIPYTVEGFMFKRNKENNTLTQTCDLIAPEGFGEILGCAEKITDYDELISSMKQKDKYKDYKNYEDYALLHKYGLPFHGGIGMGIERAIRYLLDLEHVKYTKPFAVLKSNKINH